MYVMRIISIEHPLWSVVGCEESRFVELERVVIALLYAGIGKHMQVVQDRIENKTSVVVVVRDSGSTGRVAVIPGVVFGLP